MSWKSMSVVFVAVLGLTSACGGSEAVSSEEGEGEGASSASQEIRCRTCELPEPPTEPQEPDLSGYPDSPGMSLAQYQQLTAARLGDCLYTDTAEFAKAELAYARDEQLISERAYQWGLYKAYLYPVISIWGVVIGVCAGR